jgi:hypothetical protein
MDDVLELIEQFVAGKLSASDFVTRYSTVWREISDEQRHVLEMRAEVKQSYERLWLQRDFRLINDAQFEQEAKKLFGQACRVTPGTQADKTINQLKIEADAYEGDAAQRQPYQIGEAELLAEAKKALKVLSPGT